MKYAVWHRAKTHTAFSGIDSTPNSAVTHNFYLNKSFVPIYLAFKYHIFLNHQKHRKEVLEYLYLCLSASKLCTSLQCNILSVRNFTGKTAELNRPHTAHLSTPRTLFQWQNHNQVNV